MKNILIYLTFIVVLPASFSSPDSKGCSSKKSGLSDKCTDKTEHSDDKDKNLQAKKKKASGNDISCYPFFSID